MNIPSPNVAFCRLWSDDVSLYIATKVPTKPLAKIIIGGFALFFALPVPIILWMGGGPALPTAVLAFAVWLFVCGRIAFWNIFGEELIILNTKSVSYQRSYGIIETNLRTYPYDHLRIASIVTKEENAVEYSKLQFYRYDEHDLPELLVESSIALPEHYITAIFQHVNAMFTSEEGFPPISLN